MKRINYCLGMMALSALGLASCSSDTLTPSEPESPGQQGERAVYVNIAIHGDPSSATRADGDLSSVPGFEDGNDDPNDPNDLDENKVNSIYLVFYDAQGNVVGSPVAFKNDFTPSQTENGTVESTAQSTVTITIPQGQGDPTSVICYINPVNPADLRSPLSEVQKVLRDDVYTMSGESKIFPMSNSVFYPSTSLTEEPQLAATVGKIYDDLTAANEALKNNEYITDIYVERYAAKVTLTVASNAVAPYITATTADAELSSTITEIPVQLTFNVLGWGVNGQDSKTFAVKSFRQSTGAGIILPENMNYGDLNEVINGSKDSKDWIWNSPENHRSYWARSPLFFEQTYPDVLTDYDKESSNQIFYSWDYLTTASHKTDLGYNPTKFGSDNPAYVRETTIGKVIGTLSNPNAAVASVVICGQYSIKVGGTYDATNKAVTGGTAVDGFKTFYTYTPSSEAYELHPSVYFEEDAGSDVAASEVTVEGTTIISMKKRFLWQTNVLYKAVPNNTEKPDYVALSAGNEADLKTMAAATNIARPSNDVLGDIKMADRVRTLQLTGQSLENIYINDNGTPKKIMTNDDYKSGYDAAQTEEAKTAFENANIKLDDANFILWQQVGTCNKYDLARGFFNIPIRHLGYYRPGNKNADGSMKKIDLTNAKVGDYGLVRNHVYTIQVDKISGLAPGVGDKGKPIIPPSETKDLFANYRINILKWAVVPTQTVEL